MLVHAAVQLSPLDPHLGDSHDVLGEGPRLVRANAGGRAQGLYRFHVLHQHLLQVHLLSCESERNCHCGQKALRHVRHYDPYAEHDVCYDVVLVDDPEDEESDPQEDSHGAHYLDEPFELEGHGGFLTFGCLSQISDLSNDGVAPSEHDHSFPLPKGAFGPKEGHVGSLQNALVRGVVSAQELVALPCQRRVVHLHLIRLDNPHVRWDVVPAYYLHYVPRHQLRCCQSRLLPISYYVRHWWDVVLEFRHQSRTFRRLVVGETPCDEHHSR